MSKREGPTQDCRKNLGTTYYFKIFVKMEVALALFCRWCLKSFSNKVSRYRHEDTFHPRERKAINDKFFESEVFVKCSVCSIYTLRDVQSIGAHSRSQHHLCKIRNAHVNMDEDRITSSSTLLASSAALPLQYFEEISAYPRTHAGEAPAAPASRPLTQAIEVKAAAAAAASASLVSNSTATVEASEELEDEVALRNTRAAETATGEPLFNCYEELETSSNYRFEEEGIF